MAGSRCKRRLEVRRLAMASTTAGVDVELPRDTASFTLRVVDAAGAPVAFTVEAMPIYSGAPFHFAAGEGWAEDRMALDDPQTLNVTSAATTHVVELIVWRS